MWWKWRIWLPSVLMVIISFGLLFWWMDVEVKIFDSVGNNESWMALVTKDDQTTEEGLAISAMKRLLIDGNDLTSEQKFADLMIMSNAYTKLNYNSYELYWLTISDTLTDQEKINKTIEATKRLLFADTDFSQKLTDISTVASYKVNDSSELDGFGYKLRYYVSNKVATENVLLGKVDYQTLLIPVDKKWEWLWILVLILFLITFSMLIIHDRLKRRSRG